MSNKIKKVAVLGAGVMGAQISGHLANAGIPSYLFDINDEFSKKGKDSLKTLKPAPLYNPKNIDLIKTCSYKNDLDKIKDADWILEAVVEKLEIKEKVYSTIIPKLKESAILSSNTSGIPLADLTKTFQANLKKKISYNSFF